MPPVIAEDRIAAAVATLRGTGWLAMAGAGFADWVVSELTWRTYSAGEGISHAGHDGGWLYCIGDGQLHFTAGIGVADIGIGYIGLPGAWWGHAQLLGRPLVGSAVAASDMLCGALPRSVLAAHLAAQPESWRAITLGVAGLWHHSAGAHADLLITDSRRRVAATILRMAGYRHRMHPLSPLLVPPAVLCTQEQLAGAVALSRNTVGHILRELEGAALIDARYGRLAVLDAAGLMAVAAGDG